MASAPQRRKAPDEWLSLQLPVWVPFLWWAVLAASIIASMAGDPPTACSVQDPCQPDHVFPVVVALAGLSALSIWRFPVTGLAAGAGCAVLGVLFDPSLAGRYADVVTGAVALGLLLMVRALRSRQAQLGARDCGPDLGTRWPDPGGGRPRRTWGWNSAVVPAAGAVGLLLLLSSMGAYLHQTGVERAHLDRAVTAQARVVTYTDDDYRQVFEIENGARAGDRVRIEVIDELTKGQVWPILLDPDDPSWVRLVSEPHGVTSWFGWGLLGGAVVVWCAGHEVARARAQRLRGPARRYQVRLLGDGAAELLLAGESHPVAVVPLAGDPDAPRGRTPVPARVWGAVADGGWVRIQTELENLPVVGPLRANPQWRALNIGAGPGKWAETVRARVEVVGQVLWRVFLVALGCGLVWFGLYQAGPAWAAAHGRGVTGQVTVTSESCGKGGCHYSGDFRSDDGRYSFTDVALVGASGQVGSAVPAYYEGQGDTPEAVYGNGWAGLVESGFFIGLAVLTAGEPLLRLLTVLTGRRRPPSGRHAAGRT